MDSARPMCPHLMREPLAPLMVGAVVALGLHALLLPLSVWLPSPPSPHASRLARLDAPQAPPPPTEPTIGQEASRTSTVAWIAYDDFRELIARQSAVEQPALQHKQAPVPDAPAELDPTPPAPTPQVARQVPPLPPALPPPTLAQPLPTPKVGGDIPFTRREPRRKTNREQTPPSPPVESASREASPTSSPRSDRESPPAMVLESPLDVQPGGVVARRGIEIKTFAPRFSAVTLASTLPNNPRAAVTFDHTGQVTRVVLTRSSGAANVDGPVIASLYRWRAGGDRIDRLGDATLTIHINVLLVEE